jgi:methionyl-tRNA formyltransferase
VNRASLKIIFAGTPDFAAQHLQALLNGPHHVVAVYSQPDRPAGRGRKLAASPVKALALEHSIEVQQPVSLNDTSAQHLLAHYEADVMVVVAYGLILPQAVLDTPRLGCINVHGSLLPRWRGAAPIQRAILSGDEQSGITVMQMEAGLDTGPMLLKIEVPIAINDTSESLYAKLAVLGCKGLVETLYGLQNSMLTPQVQNDTQANYADKLTKAEGAIDWHSNHPVGTLVGLDKTGLEVVCGHGHLKITQLQWPNGKTLNQSELMNLKQKMILGEVFTSLGMAS